MNIIFNFFVSEKLKDGCEKNKEIQEVIEKNRMALKSIDNTIDKDIKNDIMRFNPEMNDQLRMKLLSTRISFTPLREEKFTNLLNNFVSNIERHNEIKKIREVEEIEEIDEDEPPGDEILFQAERNLIMNLNRK